jgi:hypothetical protein
MDARGIIALGAFALLAACKPAEGGDVALKNVSLAEASAQARTANKLQSGQWESQTRILSVEMPGAPKELADALGKSASAKVNTLSDCLTPEEAEKPAAGMFAGSPAGECRYEKFAMAGGRMDSTMVCKSPDQPGEVRMTMAGDYTPTGFAFDMTMNMPAAGIPGGKGIVMRARTEGRRTGECTAPPARGTDAEPSGGA